jgi:hypothetical protein
MFSDSPKASPKNKGAYVDNQKRSKLIMDSTIMFLSSRWLENIFGSFYLEPERRNNDLGVLAQPELARQPRLVPKPARMVCPSSSNARLDYTIALFLSS